MKNQKLELTWIGKDKQPKVEPRILIEDKEKSYGDENTENMLIHGDNLLALKALEDKFTNKIKCIYIDPPYNTGSAFEHYDDNLEHSIWLNLMKSRLEIMKRLLSDNGLIWIQIDDGEMAYLKVLCDEIFGRENFINTISIQVSPPNGVKMNHAEKKILKEKEYILVFCKNRDFIRFKPEYIKAKSWDSHYNKFIDGNLENISTCKVISMTDKLKELKLNPDINNEEFNKWVYENKNRIFQPVGLAKIKNNPKYNKDYIVPIEEMPGYLSYKGRQVQLVENSIYNTDDGNVLSRMVCDFWTDIAFNNLFQEGNGDFKAGKKPEKLLKRIINMSSEEGDYVMDSFLGSGTTCAVAHKMNRKWIGIELEEHCYTHCIPRINDVIDNKDPNGITSLVDWQGGGGYKFYELAPSLLVKDKFDNWVISENYNGELLTRAICKQEKFDYSPDDNYYWKQGKSSENDYIYVTTNYISLEYLQAIREEMQSNESLLICCKSYQEECKDKYDNITIKKIPQSILNNCEYSRDDYSLNVEEILEVDEDE